MVYILAVPEKPSKERKQEIIQKGSQLPGVSDASTMTRKFKGWDKSGSGGFGTVYMTKDSGAKALVAVKVAKQWFYGAFDFCKTGDAAQIRQRTACQLLRGVFLKRMQTPKHCNLFQLLCSS